MRLTAFPSGFYRLAATGAVHADSVEARRAAVITGIDRARKRGLTVVEACGVFGLAKATYYRWKARLKRLGVAGLRALRSGNRRKRFAPVRSWVRELVVQERMLQPGGKRQIHYRLLLRGFRVSLSTVGRVLRELFDRKVLLRLGYRKRNKVLSSAAKRAHALRKKSGVRAAGPGDLVQVDTMQERSLERARFHFTAVDPTTKVVHARLLPSATSRNAKVFLLELAAALPFPLRSIQVDNGSEFKGEFEAACAELGIKLFTIPPRSPKWNGMVERMQRTFRDEHYAFESDFLSREEQQAALQAYVHYYNHGRIHSAIGDVPPMEYAEKWNFQSQQT